MKSLFAIIIMGISMMALVNSQGARGQRSQLGPAEQSLFDRLLASKIQQQQQQQQQQQTQQPITMQQNPGASRPANNLNNFNNQNTVRPRPNKQNFNNNANQNSLNKRLQNQWQNQPVDTTPANGPAPGLRTTASAISGMGGSFGLIFGDLFNAIVEERVRGMRQDDKLKELQTDVAALRKEVNVLTKEMAIAKPLSQKLSDLIQSKSRKIAFVAELKSGKTFTAGTKILFETTKFNMGQGYNTSDGVFYAPVDGLYLFSAFVIAEAKGYHAQILKNDGFKDAPIGYMYTHDNNAWGSASTTVVVSLKRGDKVWVNSFDKSLISNWSTFSGSLIR